jgi:tetratricopeptide (TPR) repeat protein
VLIDLGKAEQAMRDAEHLVRVAGNDARSFNVRGLARHHQGAHAKAIEDFDRSIALNPELHFVYENRAISYASMGQHDTALADIDRALAVNARSQRAITIGGQIYMARGETERAITEFKKALAIDPNFAPAQLGLQTALVAKSMSPPSSG